MRLSFTLVLTFALVACASSSQKQKSNSIPTQETTTAEIEVSPEKLKEYCDQGSYMACFTLGQEALEKKKPSEALRIFENNCEKNFHAYSCTQAGFLKRQEEKDIKSAIALSAKACKMMDAVGCYNLACYNCINKNVDATLSFLKEAENIGFDFNDQVLADPDLGCVKDNPLLKNLVEASKSQYRLRTSPYHVFFPSYSLAMIPPVQFSWDGSPTIVFADSSGAFVQPLIYAQDYADSLKQYQNKNLKDLVIKEREVNGLKSFVGIKKVTVNGRVFKEVTSFTGDQNYTVGAVGNYPEDFEKMLGENIFRSLLTIIYKPIPIPAENTLPFDSKAQELGFRFGGFFNTSAVYHYQGEFSNNQRARIFVQLIKYSDEESFKKEKPESFCKNQEGTKSEKPFQIFPFSQKGFDAISCENTVTNDILPVKTHIRGWILSRKAKKDRLVVQSTDDEQQSHRQQIEKFVHSLKLKK